MGSAFSLSFGLPGVGALLHFDALTLFFCVLLAVQMLASGLAGLRRCFEFWGFGLGWILVLLAGDGLAAAPGVALVLVFTWQLRRRKRRDKVCTAGLIAACLLNLVFYGVLRCGFAGVAPYWGLVVLGFGALLLGGGALRAAFAVPLQSGLDGLLLAYEGGVVISLGLAMYSHACLQGQVTSLALRAVLLGLLVQAVLRPVFALGAFVVESAVGTTSLNWLGGLMRGMPRLGVLILVGVFSAAAVPPGPGFAPLCLLVQALLATAGQGGVLVHAGVALLLAWLGVAWALLLLATVRMIGMGFLGRPRSLHAAAAEDISRIPFWAMALPSATLVPLALVPGLILALCSPILYQLVPHAPFVELAYAPLTLLVLAGMALLLLGVVQARFGQGGLQEVPVWTDGFGRPPAWLPFGDPQTQTSASSLTQPLAWLDLLALDIVRKASCLARAQTQRLVKAVQHVQVRTGLAVLFGALILALLIFGCVHGG